MCLVTYQKEPIQLDKDLIVWKEVCVNPDTNETESVFFKFFWEKGVLHETELNKTEDLDYYDDTVGNHYDILCREDNIRNARLIRIGGGFHAFCSEERIPDISYKTIKRFLIPKGSLVYYDETGLIVSNQMMLL